MGGNVRDQSLMVFMAVRMFEKQYLIFGGGGGAYIFLSNQIVQLVSQITGVYQYYNRPQNLINNYRYIYILFIDEVFTSDVN